MDTMRNSLKLTMAMLALLAIVACTSGDTERDAILVFTRQALQIELGRDDLVRYLRERYAPSIGQAFFLRGNIEEGLPSASQLKSQMLLLDSPPFLQAIKDSLVEAYQLEIEAAQLDRQSPEAGNQYFLPRIDRFNLDSYKEGGAQFAAYRDMSSPWVIAQELRRDTYIKWAQLLRVHGIDPAKEGFTSLVQSWPTPTPPPIPTPTSSGGLTEEQKRWREEHGFSRELPTPVPVAVP